jgi:hypothetical protein
MDWQRVVTTRKVEIEQHCALFLIHGALQLDAFIASC